jgi:hypothetical protein
MAKKSGYRGLMRASFGALSIPNTAVQTHSVLVGALVGAAGALGIRWLWNNYAPASLKTGAAVPGSWQSYLDDALPVLGGLGLGAALYYGQKKSAMGFAHAVGAATAGLGMAVLNIGQNFLPAAFSGVVAVNLNGYRGIVVPDKSRGALKGIVTSSQGGSRPWDNQQPRLAGVQRAATAAIAMRRSVGRR